MSFVVDTTTYNKAAAYPQRHGYQLRGTVPISIVVHSTEGKPGQSLASAANYLYTSADVSAHFLVGKAGEIIQFLDPKKYQAWHAGQAQEAYQNARSIGVECLHAKTETWPAVQKEALGWLLGELMAAHAIAGDMIDTHGQIAIPGPYQRKIDPTDWPHADFIAWRDVLIAPSFRMQVRGVPVYQEEDCTGPLWGYLVPGEVVTIDMTYDDERAHLSDGRGFIWLDDSVVVL